MKRLWLLGLVLTTVHASTVLGESGSWNLYLNASSMYRVTQVGDSLWCATNGGIVLFDLRDSTITQYIGGLDFRSNRVSAVTVDRRGSVWAGFFTTGVVRIEYIDTDPFVKQYSAAIDGLVSDSVTALVSIEDDVYYGSMSGAAKFYNGLPSPEIILTDSLEGVPVYDLAVSGDTLLWAATDEGMARFNRLNDSFTHFRIGRVTSCCEYGGDMYAATSTGIQRFDGTDWTLIAGTLPEFDLVPHLVASGGGELYCATEESAYRWDGSIFLNVENREMKDVFDDLYRIRWGRLEIMALAVDDRGTPWVGGEFSTQLRGCYLTGYIGDTWQNKAFENISHNSTLRLSLDPAGGVWLSTWHFGISHRTDDGRWVWYTESRDQGKWDALSYWKIHLGLLCDTGGRLWAGTLNFDLDRVILNDRLDRGDDAWRHYTLGEGTITTNRFIRIKEDPAGNIWCLSDQPDIGINIMKADSTAWMSVEVEQDKLVAGNVVDCAFGRFGRVYLALSNVGVQLWETRGYDWETLTSESGDRWTMLFNTTQRLYSITTNDTVTWTGAANSLIRYESGRVDSIKVKSQPGEYGLVNGQVNDVEYDGQGNLWAATAGGLQKIDRTGGITETYTSFEHWQENLSLLYPASIVSPLLSQLIKALQYDPDGDMLWIATEIGLARLDVSPQVPEELPLSQMILYPNPVHGDRGDNELRIARISGSVAVYVYNLEGELVHEGRDVHEGEVAWDLLTLNGFKATSGIYLVRVTNGRHSEYRKIAVIK